MLGGSPGNGVEGGAFRMQPGNGFHQGSGVGMPGMFQKLLRQGRFPRCGAAYMTLMRSAYRAHHAEVMRDEDDGGAHVLLKFSDEIQHLLLDSDVKGGGGFIRR